MECNGSSDGDGVGVGVGGESMVLSFLGVTRSMTTGNKTARG